MLYHDFLRYSKVYLLFFFLNELVSDSLPPKVCLHKFKEKKKRNPIECVAVVFLFYKLDFFTQLSFRKYHHDPQNLLPITVVPPPPIQESFPQNHYYLSVSAELLQKPGI